ncbi:MULTISPECIES: flagellar biosynthesis anti-sigma factor FlgM [Comamonas]|uniref:flagellar biosynthesis anti-sigma factor FlgM n=1 Tax=Comamonas TaxID=283 RepID=UPI00237EB583|nr:flagellar biosynthesis anti-sigma factor FlgM [Comamonas aquatica]MDE1555441.1 flagellar biosynthesis anti-sigma factor FlgM [Comamonas aquatica]
MKENTQVIFQAADSKTTEPGAGTLEKNMKVGHNTNVEMLAAKPQQNAAQQAQQKQNGTASEVVQQTRANAAGVPVTVSNSVRSLDQNSKSSSDVDMAKVNAIREAIANGTFKVNASVVADKMLVDAAGLLGASRV